MLKRVNPMLWKILLGLLLVPTSIITGTPLDCNYCGSDHCTSNGTFPQYNNEANGKTDPGFNVCECERHAHDISQFVLRLGQEILHNEWIYWALHALLSLLSLHDRHGPAFHRENLPQGNKIINVYPNCFKSNHLSTLRLSMLEQN